MRAEHSTSIHGPYRTGPKRRKVEKARIDKILAKNIVKPSQTEWPAPMLFDTKAKQNSLILRRIL